MNYDYSYNPQIPAFLTNSKESEAQEYILSYRRDYEARYKELDGNSGMDDFKAWILGITLLALTILAATALGVSAVDVAYKASGIVGICAVGTTLAICTIIKFSASSSRQMGGIAHLNTQLASEYQLKFQNRPNQPKPVTPPAVESDGHKANPLPAGAPAPSAPPQH